MAELKALLQAYLRGRGTYEQLSDYPTLARVVVTPGFFEMLELRCSAGATSASRTMRIHSWSPS